MTNQDITIKEYTPGKRLRAISFVLIAVGLASLAYGFITDPQRAWANLLLNNFYFLSLGIGAAFFYALQYISQSGWSAQFKRVPEAMMFIIPVAAAVSLLLLFGLDHLYHWAHDGAADHDALLAHKSPYLNVPFFAIRIIAFFGLWILLTQLLRRLSLREDKEGGMRFFERSEFWSKVLIFVIALTFSLASFDFIMSIDPHWYSTLFALKNFVAAFYHGSAVIVLIVLLLHSRGYFDGLNSSHLLDFARYLFMLSIVWGYLYFAQFMLIWYANIPEETVYFHSRWADPSFKFLFYANIVLNWFIPFIVLISQKADKNKTVLMIVCLVLIVGQYVDLYDQIFPGTVGRAAFGITELGTWLGFAGLFSLVVSWALSKAPIIARNHPYLSESVFHHVH
ncbi:MAG TPA: hypothetical protein P5550_05430 [Bacteroidales bacterium]|nr:hypothetical protein [Bacteroidales bacterium]HRZ77196.1 hypothetical protein [Bacteroidales bacterium]